MVILQEKEIMNITITPRKYFHVIHKYTWVHTRKQQKHAWCYALVSFTHHSPDGVVNNLHFSGFYLFELNIVFIWPYLVIYVLDVIAWEPGKVYSIVCTLQYGSVTSKCTIQLGTQKFTTHVFMTEKIVTTYKGWSKCLWPDLEEEQDQRLVALVEEV